MTGVLITFNFASMVFLFWVFVSGYHISAMRNHITMALAATALSLFSHSLTMMYFAAVGRMIRQAVEGAGLDHSYVVQTKSYRKIIFRAAGIAMLLVMLNTILAGGAHTHMFPVIVHTILAALALFFNAYAVYLEVRYLIQNHLLGHRVARQFERAKRN